ncbi:MAG: adenylosuccinate synthetase [Nanobdellota archaeon]
MGVDCLVGLQWGSEGKGKIAAYLAPEYSGMVRSGAPQAGHTFYHEGHRYVNRQLPCGVFTDSLLYLSTSSLVNLDVLAEELVRYRLYPDRVMIDNHAMVITEEHRMRERQLTARISSTGEGVGAAQVDKVMRKTPLFDRFAEEDPELYFYCGDTVGLLNQQIGMGQNVLLEGTQGFGLSLNHGAYPYVTSRDVNASSLLSDSGIAPNHHSKTIGVLRTYPIRVAGNSGPTGSEEISWEEIGWRSGAPRAPSEYTTVTGRLRRVFEQNINELKRAVLVNQPDELALTFIDYINFADYGKQYFSELSPESKDYVSWIQDELAVPVTLIGTGEQTLIDRRGARPRAQVQPLFPDNFYGYDWDSGQVGRFLRRKLDHEPRIF